MYKLFKFYLLKPFFIWLFIFQIFKFLFISYHFSAVSNEVFSEIFKVFIQGTKLDISSVSYLLMVPFVLVIIQFFCLSLGIKKALKYYTYFILGFISVLNVVDIILYSYWSSKISLKSLLFLSMPQQVIAATGVTNLLMGFVFVIFHFIIGKYLFDKFLFQKKLKFKQSFFLFMILLLFSASAIVVGIRGGLQEVPINQSVAYYSSNNTLNIAGVNPFWNFMNMLVQNKKYLNENPYKKLEKKEAEVLVKQLFELPKDSTINLFTQKKPNIVFLTLEGVNAKVFKAFGNKNNHAPKIDSLFKTGYLYTEMYAAGFRSDQGLVAMLGGFPPTPISSIASQPEKFIQLPSLVSKIKSLNYETSFYTGVEATFGNLKSYLVSNSFDNIIDLKDFPSNKKTQSLGVPDAFLFDKFSEDLSLMNEPFFSMVFTSTTHEPYDMPFNKGIFDERQRYLNTVKYLDSVVIKNINMWKRETWYKNTIFVLTSDHAHFHPGNYAVDENRRFHIPFLIFGEALKPEFEGKQNTTIFSQVDIPKTIAAQLNLKNDDFVWSKNMLNPYSKSFAFYTYVEGCVLKTDYCNHGWEYRYDKAYGNQELENAAVCIKQSQAFLQELYDQYLAY